MNTINWFRKLLGREPGTPAAPAYDRWAASYDQQEGNLVLDLDELLFSALLGPVNLAGKTVADIGCGTGRHWPKILQRKPARLLGFDVSAGMLKKLKEKFPGAETYLLKGHQLPGLANGSCDLIVSTLTLAHLPDLALAMDEWIRVLKPGGEILLTDYHPAMLQHGGKRSFRQQEKTTIIRNYIHPIAEIREQARQRGVKEKRLIERKIDGQVKQYYDAQNAGELYRRFEGIPVIYAMHLITADVAPKSFAPE